MKIEEKIDKFINESSLSRIWQFVEDKNKQFGVMSAFRGDLSSRENEERHKELKDAVREMGYGFVELKGGYEEEVGIVEEKSLFIPNISKKEIIELGKRYNQDSVIFKDSREFSIIGTNKFTGIGKVIANFRFSAGRENLVSGMKDLFSALAKGSHKGKKFLFFMED